MKTLLPHSELVQLFTDRVTSLEKELAETNLETFDTKALLLEHKAGFIEAYLQTLHYKLDRLRERIVNAKNELSIISTFIDRDVTATFLWLPYLDSSQGNGVCLPESTIIRDHGIKIDCIYRLYDDSLILSDTDLSAETGILLDVIEVYVTSQKNVELLTPCIFQWSKEGIVKI